MLMNTDFPIVEQGLDSRQPTINRKDKERKINV
jgi:hypothetical protein